MIMKRILVNCLLGVACVSVVGAVIAVNFGVNNGPELSVSPTNVKAAKLDLVGEGAVSGNVFYFNYENWHDWYNASGGTWLYFMDAGDAHNTWVKLNNELFSYYYQVVVPGEDITFTKVLAVRAANNWEVGNWSTLWNQTNDVILSSNNNAIRVDDPQGKPSVYATAYYHAASERIKLWGQNTTLVPWMSNTFCNPLGNTDGISDAWTTSQNSYGQIIGKDVLSYFSNISTSDGSADATVKSIAARYDHIVSAYGFTDYAHRG